MTSCRSQVPTLGFSPGTSTYVAMLCTLLRLAAELAQLAGADGDLTAALGRLPAQVETTLRLTADGAPEAAALLLSAPWTAFLGAGPNEATARFGAAKLIEGAQRLGVATNLEEWAHEEYFVTSAGDPVVLVNPSGAGHDRGAEILSELEFIGARPVVISDGRPAHDASPGSLAAPDRGRRSRRAVARHGVPAAGPDRLPPRQAGRQAVLQLREHGGEGRALRNHPPSHGRRARMIVPAVAGESC